MTTETGNSKPEGSTDKNSGTPLHYQCQHCDYTLADWGLEAALERSNHLSEEHPEIPGHWSDHFELNGGVHAGD